ncbi:unnamed protein product [Fraxinus pennsylvanica]|uniref:Inhibitor I9 domain-containing protein n=1 Tax=Fraxinus pennsylvanica TaxID=56036 RepID=A0AAD2AG87_9LAMI|nr:unnamed protein product [Fraxinus pennsylvanica]
MSPSRMEILPCLHPLGWRQTMPPLLGWRHGASIHWMEAPCLHLLGLRDGGTHPSLRPSRHGASIHLDGGKLNASIQDRNTGVSPSWIEISFLSSLYQGLQETTFSLSSSYLVGCCDRVLFDLGGGETERLSSMNMFRTLINRRASRSIKTWGLAEAPKWMVWRRSFIDGHLLTKEQVSRLESRNLKPYIVHVAQPTGSPVDDDLLSYYHTFLPKTAAGEESRMLYAYNIAITGFAAYLSPEEVKAMEKIPGFYLAREPRAVTFFELGSNQNMGFQKGKGLISKVKEWTSMSESMRKEWSQSKTQEANLGEETNGSN